MTLTAAQITRYRVRIADSVHKTATGCWLWTKSRSHNGYGRFALGGGKDARAHRISYAVFVGPIPPKIDVCHQCDVRACVNPTHLFLGTRSENILDAASKGRVSRDHQFKGSAHPSAKLTEDDIPEILQRLAEGHTKASIARAYGVTARVILLIARGLLWTHVRRTA